VTGFGAGDTVKLAIDARGGPFTLTFPPRSYLDGHLMTEPGVFNGLVYLRMSVTYMPAFDWVAI
jgi:hypothetical protein